MNDWILSVGNLRTSPTAKGTRPAKWWAVVDVDTEIGKYFRSLRKLNHPYFPHIVRPAWNEHITVVRNEEPTNKNLWDSLNGRSFEFSYSNITENDGKHYWMPVRCDLLLDIREELGLPRNPHFPLHLTIGFITE